MAMVSLSGMLAQIKLDRGAVTFINGSNGVRLIFQNGAQAVISRQGWFVQPVNGGLDLVDDRVMNDVVPYFPGVTP